ncbi:MAG: DUF3592 domain-containing protein [Verrucomicrobiales bacterium]|nr:DUF3592 domain-containing protein [Verrucomicrobiales bacterium]
MQIDWISIIAFSIIGLGAICIIFGLAHEVTWMRRRGWLLSQGQVVDHEGDRKDGKVLYPVIEYHTELGSKSFVSKYGSGKPPQVGDVVQVAHHPSMLSQEHFSVSNRILFTVLSIASGLVVLSVGFVLLHHTPGDQVEVEDSLAVPVIVSGE